MTPILPQRPYQQHHHNHINKRYNVLLGLTANSHNPTATPDQPPHYQTFSSTTMTTMDVDDTTTSTEEDPPPPIREISFSVMMQT
jgi:hypothetical protein